MCNSSEYDLKAYIYLEGVLMQIYFWTKKQLGRLVLIFFTLVVLGMVGYDYWSNDLAVTTMKAQPIYQGDPNYKKMALTFNVDWGEEYLPDMLEILKSNNVKATFFVTGRFAAKFPQLVQKIAAEGHEIGNHGYSHPHPDKISKRENQNEIKKAEAEIIKTCGVKTTLFAPPYGEHKPHVVEAAEEIGYKTILWTIDTIDWDKSRQPEVIYEKVIKSAQNGAIVLMHPTDRTVLALEKMIRTLQEQEYDLVTVSEILP